ncbi:hypothetical protein [Methanobrevibacter sp.]|uniref:hypothetical protein n=1 Tax=Methanobrevibacter sp. TaxID=66852 RepID=UPI00388E60DC
MKTNGIEAGSGLHSANNLIVFYLSLLGLSQVHAQASIIDSLMGVAVTAIAGFLILYIGKKYDWFTSHE